MIDLLSFIFYSVSLVFIFSIIIYFIHNYYFDKYNNSFNTNEFRKCPAGCRNTKCIYKNKCNDWLNPDPLCCVSDTQCQNCFNRHTNKFITKAGNIPVNKEINKINNYIYKLNREIERENNNILC